MEDVTMVRYGKFGIYLIIFLVLSITPATAVQINDLTNNNLNKNIN